MRYFFPVTVLEDLAFEISLKIYVIDHQLSISAIRKYWPVCFSLRGTSRRVDWKGELARKLYDGAWNYGELNGKSIGESDKRAA